MKTKKPKNPDAFPCDNKSEGYSGMTLRDYFANSAMQSIVSNTDRLKFCAQKAISIGSEWENVVAENSYSLADAMLKQRELNEEKK